MDTTCYVATTPPRDGVFPKKRFLKTRLNSGVSVSRLLNNYRALQSHSVRNQGCTMNAHAHLHTAGNDVLKQTGVPNLAPKIVDVQPDQEMHDYFAKYTTALGIVHIICGVVNMVAAAFITKAFDSVDDVDHATEATATVTSEATYERVWPSISGETLCRDNCQLIGMPFFHTRSAGKNNRN